MANLVTSTWSLAGGGNWFATNGWTGAIPQNNTADAVLATLGQPYTVTLSAPVDIGFLEVDQGASLSITNATLSVTDAAFPWSNAILFGAIQVGAGGTLSLGLPTDPGSSSTEINGSGKVSISSTGAEATLQVADSWFGLSGGGKIVLAGNAQIIGSTQSSTNLDNISDTIKGYGTIGNGPTTPPSNGLSLTNESRGIINANGGAGQVLTLNTGSHNIYNDGLLKSTGAGGLVIDSQLNNDGRLQALGTGAVRLNNTFVGGNGTVYVAAGSSLKLNNSGINYLGGGLTIGSAAANGGTVATVSGNTTGADSTNTDVGDFLNATTTNYGTLKIHDNSTLNLTNNVFNLGNGKIFINGGANKTTLELFQYGASILGGQILLSDSLNNAIVSNGTSLSLNTNADISGSGVIGDGWLNINLGFQGVVNSDGAAGLTIEEATHSSFGNSSNGLVETTGAGGLAIVGKFSNGGEMLASGSGALTLSGSQIQGNGKVEAATGGTIVLKGGASLNYGYVSIDAGGKLVTTAGDSGANADTINGMTTVAGTVTVVGGSDLVLGSNLMNSGQIVVDGSATAAEIEISGGLNLLDGGTIQLKGPNASIVGASGSSGLNLLSQTIMGSGVLGDLQMGINNSADGIIDATGASGLTIISQFLNNSGLIESNSAGGLIIQGGLNNGGELLANTGGNVTVAGNVQGTGIVEIDGSGQFEIGGNANSAIVFGAGGAGELILDNSSQPSGQIAGFAVGDAIDLRDFAFVQGSMNLGPQNNLGDADGNFQITNGTANSSVFWLEGNYSSANLNAQNLQFSFTDDGHFNSTTGHDGTLVKLVSKAAA